MKHMRMCADVFRLKSMLRLGKHRGQRYEEVAAADRGYCAWILREKALPQGFSSFYKYLINVHGGIMQEANTGGNTSMRFSRRHPTIASGH